MIHSFGFFYFTDQSGTLFTNWLVNSNMSFRTSQRTCELRNEVRNICGQSFVKSTVKSSPGWGIFHSQLAQGPCISLQVVSPHPGIYTIITNQIKCPGVFLGGGTVTPGIDSCIIEKWPKKYSWPLGDMCTTVHHFNTLIKKLLKFLKCIVFKLTFKRQ